MSLAWGSKFLEYSATANIVNTSPAVVRCLRWAGEPCKVHYFAHSQVSLGLPGDFTGCKVKFKTICEKSEEFICTSRRLYELRPASGKMLA
jgi:hypothetical protein